ncbi:MAG: hypothetical protein AAGC93_01980 [Cyanobacteria bacterium P01_F01_bin.53]
MRLARISHHRSLPIKLYDRDVVTTFHLCTSTLFCIMGVIVLPVEPWVGVRTLVFFGTCVAIFIHQLRQGSRLLRLDYAGFTVSYSPSSEYQVPWQAVASFVVVNEQWVKRVGWRYEPGYYQDAFARADCGHLAIDIDAMLPANYGVRPKVLWPS